MPINFHGYRALITLTFLSLLIPFINILISARSIVYTTHVPEIAFVFLIVWMVATISFVLISYKEFVTGYLLSLFCMMVAWRIAGLYDISSVTIPLCFTFVFMLLNFLYCAWMNLKYPEKYLHPVSREGWQLIFIRLYIGIDFIPHFTEKLFAGPFPHSEDVNAFLYLGVQHADFFVWLAGMFEFGAAIALSLGLLMRLGAVCAVLYLIVATYLGHHFSLGFIWAGPGGGWEFAMMWIVLILAYAVTGAHQFSVDQRLEDSFKLTKFVKALM